MESLATVAPAFVTMAHQIVWCSVATTDTQGRPRSRILHPIWQWDGNALIGWIATGPTPIKRAHLQANPYVSLSYWSPNHDTCAAECKAEWCFDLETRTAIWNLLATTPPPLGYNPTMIPSWTGPEVAAFAVLRLTPWRLRVFPGSALLGQGGSVLNWRAEDAPAEGE